MLSKLVVIGTILAYSYAQHHAISSQSIIHHEKPAPHHQPPPSHHHYAPAPALHYAPAPSHYAPASQKGHAVSSQSIQLSQHAPSHAPASLGYAPASYAYAPHKSSHQEEEYGHPAYKYEYSVHDPHTGDEKSQSESRDGDAVQGEYSLLQPDGQIRKVTYHADKHSGFNAHVSYSGHKSQ